MSTTTHPEYWQRQTADRPLFDDMLWSRPENKLYAGKLLVIGGNAHGFVAPAEAYRHAEAAGIGVVRMVLPDSMQRFVGKVFEAGDFAPSTPVGSFSQRALGELLPFAAWGDAVLLAGNFGRNSETAILLEKFVAKYKGPLTVCGDAVDYFLATPLPVLSRKDTLMALTFVQLQKLAAGAHSPKAFTSQLDLLHFVETLHDFSTWHKAHIVVRHLGQTFVAVGGRISSTPDTEPVQDVLQTASYAAVWSLQTPGRPYEAITTSVISRHS